MVNIDNQNTFYFNDDDCIDINSTVGSVSVSDNTFNCNSGKSVTCTSTNNITIEHNIFNYTNSGEAIFITQANILVLKTCILMR